MKAARPCIFLRFERLPARPPRIAMPAAGPAPAMQPASPAVPAQPHPLAMQGAPLPGLDWVVRDAVAAAAGGRTSAPLASVLAYLSLRAARFVTGKLPFLYPVACVHLSAGH